MAKPKHLISAFIYDKQGRLLSMGQNSYFKTHPLQAKYAADNGESYKHFLHAEIAAIVKCKNIDKAHKLVVIRLGKDGNPRMAAPCEICQKAISFTPIKIIEHTKDPVQVDLRATKIDDWCDIPF